MFGCARHARNRLGEIDMPNQSAVFRFYAELNDFLAPGQRQRVVTREFELPGSVKDMIESFGVPHTEVDLVLANGESVDFGYQVRGGDTISVYPVFETLDIGPIARVRPEPLRHIQFVLDAHLGRVARYLRLLGFDTLYRNDFDDAELAGIARRERRVLLTRDRGLLKRGEVTHGYCLRHTDPRGQALEVVRRFQLMGAMNPFSRCLACNGVLSAVAKADIEHRLEPKTRRYYTKFRICEACGKIYWKGSHFGRLAGFVEEAQRLT